VMSVETKKCTITNIYSKPTVSNVTNGNWEHNLLR
jgi:hypothetical protein